MPQLAAVTINDGKATPVAHTFNPRDIVAGVATLTEGTGIPIGENQLSLSLTKTASNRRNVKLKLVLPIVQDVIVGGISRPTVVRQTTANVDFSFAEDSNPAERKDARALVANALNNALLASVMHDLQALY